MYTHKRDRYTVDKRVSRFAAVLCSCKQFMLLVIVLIGMAVGRPRATSIFRR